MQDIIRYFQLIVSVWCTSSKAKHIRHWKKTPPSSNNTTMPNHPVMWNYNLMDKWKNSEMMMIYKIILIFLSENYNQINVQSKISVCCSCNFTTKAKWKEIKTVNECLTNWTNPNKIKQGVSPTPDYQSPNSWWKILFPSSDSFTELIRGLLVLCDTIMCCKLIQQKTYF